MIYTNISLDGIIFLPIPDSRLFLQIEVISERQFLKSAFLQRIRIMDYDFSANIIAVFFTEIAQIVVGLNSWTILWKIMAVGRTSDAYSIVIPF